MPEGVQTWRPDPHLCMQPASFKLLAGALRPDVPGIQGMHSTACGMCVLIWPALGVTRYYSGHVSMAVQGSLAGIWKAVGGMSVRLLQLRASWLPALPSGEHVNALRVLPHGPNASSGVLSSQGRVSPPPQHRQLRAETDSQVHPLPAHFCLQGRTWMALASPQPPKHPAYKADMAHLTGGCQIGMWDMQHLLCSLDPAP